ncbi:MAG: Hsp20/alpha crystallin family protein [Burkholderiales bacterium]|nr:Hsp20/alpha crystallin family protein [Burkholderiales bacterium]
MASLRLFEPALNDPFESMFRRFLSPARIDRTLDEGKAVAKYEDGVLTLELPKKATSAAKRLAVN